MGYRFIRNASVDAGYKWDEFADYRTNLWKQLEPRAVNLNWVMWQPALFMTATSSFSRLLAGSFVCSADDFKLEKRSPWTDFDAVGFSMTMVRSCKCFQHVGNAMVSPSAP